MNINAIKPNQKNPRGISKAKLEKLMASVNDFPKMMALRPIVVNRDGVILGGNMRYNALVALGYKEIPDRWVKVADELNEQEERRFIIEDNVAFGDWDYELLANEWDTTDLDEWGVDVWQNKDDVQHKETKKSGDWAWFLKVRFRSEQECEEWREKFEKAGFESNTEVKRV